MENTLIIFAGGLLSILNRFLVIKMITKRNDKPTVYRFINTKYSNSFWALLGIIAGLVICFYSNSIGFKIEALIVFLICEALSAVDFAIRKIPNELLLALIVTRIVVLIFKADLDLAVMSAGGLVTGLVVFALPSYFRIYIGVGDIKFAAVAGFYLGIVLFFQAILIMGIILGFYSLYLYISKRGSLKSTTPMGPYISIGVFLSLLVPIINLI